MRTEFFVEGRKQPLLEIRERMLKNQEKYMLHRSDEEFRNMPCENLMTTLNNINEYKEGESADKMRTCLKKIERTRHVKI